MPAGLEISDQIFPGVRLPAGEGLMQAVGTGFKSPGSSREVSPRVLSRNKISADYSESRSDTHGLVESSFERKPISRAVSPVGNVYAARVSSFRESSFREASFREDVQEIIASTVKQLVSQVPSLISHEVVTAVQQENSSVLGFCREHADQADARQAEFMRHQITFMNNIVGQVSKLTESVSSLECLLQSGSTCVSAKALKADPSSVSTKNLRNQSKTASQSAVPAYFDGGKEGTGIDMCLTDCEASAEIDMPMDLDGTKVTGQPVQSMADDMEKYLRVTIVRGANFKSPKRGKVLPCDPYCVCWIPNKVRSEESEIKSPVKHQTEDPQWDYTGLLTDYSTGDSLNFKVLDKEMYAKDQVLGEASISRDALEQSGGFEGELRLQSHKGLGATLCVKVEVLQGPALLPTTARSAVLLKHSLSKRSMTKEALEEAQDLLDGIEVNTTAADTAREMLHHKKVMIIIKQLPVQVQGPVFRCFHFLYSLKEPKRETTFDKIVDGKIFFTVSLLCVLIDQGITVSATNYSVLNYNEVADSGLPTVYELAEGGLLAWFALELIAKVLVHRLFFFVGEHWWMNWLDIFLVIYSFIEVVGIDLSFLRALRVFKLAKVIRMLKALSQIRDLRVMVDCLISSGFAMFWALVLIIFVTYMFALFFVQAMTEYMMTNRSTLTTDQATLITDKFGSVEQAILSLAMSLTGGFDWEEIYELVTVAGNLTRTACLFFVVLFTISVWNIVGSIFVEKVMSTAQPSAHDIVEANETQARADAGELKEFFLEFDKDCSGSLDQDEFLMLSKEGGLAEFLALRQVRVKDADDAKAFFRMAKREFSLSRPAIESESKGIRSIPFDSLISTFLKVKGPASSLDLAIFKHEVEYQLETVIKALDKMAPAWDL